MKFGFDLRRICLNIVDDDDDNNGRRSIGIL